MTAMMVSCGIIGGLATNVTTSFADNDNSTSTITDEAVLPYAGYVSKNSVPLNTTRDIKFVVWNSASGGTILWEELQSVAIYQGKFNAAIGTGMKLSGRESSLKEAVLDAEALYIAIAIQDDTGAFIPLSGRQKVEAAPYATWSDNTATMKVEHAVRIQGNDISLGLRQDTRGDGGRALVAHNNDELIINFAGDFAGGVAVNSNLRITGAASIANNLTVDGNITAGTNLTVTNDATIRGDLDVLDNATIDGVLEVSSGGRLDMSNSPIVDVGSLGGNGTLSLYNSGSTGTPDLSISSGGDVTMVRDADAARDIHAGRDLIADNDVVVTNDVVVGGFIAADEPASCPGSTIATVTKGSHRLCVYDVTIQSAATTSTWNQANERCWDDHAAPLCTMAQFAIAREKNSNPSGTRLGATLMWLADPTDDNDAIYVNGTSDTDFDAVLERASPLNGGFCCRWVSGR